MATILIVEDDDALRNSIKRTLSMEAYDVITVSEGRGAIKAIEKERPDLVLTDIFMPGMEGLETIRLIASMCPGLPIIVMTGSLDSLFIEMSLRFGAVQGLNKPFSRDELLLAVEKALFAKNNAPQSTGDSS